MNEFKKALIFFWDTLRILVIALAIVLPIRYFLFQPFFVLGQSMEPNFGNGDYLIVDEISYRFSEAQRGDIIVFRFPQDPSQKFIKRVIGLPGETVEIKEGNVYIDKEGARYLLKEGYLPQDLKTQGNFSLTLKEKEYFVMGDNRNYSYDSRRFGPLPKENIIGKVLIRAWPISNFKIFSN